MASIPRPTYPTSCQLRFVHRGKGSSSVSFKIRARPSIRQIRLICASGGEEQSPDSFAGWSGSENEVGGNESKKKKKSDRFGGMLGAGLAGVFFTAGVTFASLSLSTRATSGVKQKMEPLTTEQEVILTSDDRIPEVDQIRNEANVVLQEKQSKLDDYDPDSQTGIDKDLLPHIENNEDSTGNSPDNIHHSPSETSLENHKSFSNGVDSIPSISSQDDFQIGPVDDIPIPSSPSPGSSEFSANVNVDLAVDSSSFKDSQNTVFSGSLDQTIIHDAKQSTVDSTTQISNEEGSSTNLDAPLDITGEIEGQPQSVPLTSNFIVLESGDIVDSQDNINEVACTESIAKEYVIGQSDILQLPTGVSTLNPEVHEILESVPSSTVSGSDLDQNETLMYPKESMISTKACILEENAPYVPYSEVVLPDTNCNTPNVSSHSQLGRISTFESTLPEKPISYAGIPAPSLVSAALQVPPGKVLVLAIVDQVQGQALAALQVLKVIEADVQPGDLCTRREYARWLVSASSALSRNTISKVYPAMYIENITELAFDDITPEDPDYSCIQGLAEAGIISSKLSESDLNGTSSGHQKSFLFSPESPVSRQDLVSWKMALERRQLPEVDKNHLYQCSGYIDVDKINKDAWPALVADLSAGEHGITALAFGYTRLFQPNKPVTKAQAAIALATGDAAEVVGEELTRIEAELLAETAVNAHTALVAQVEKELNASFEAELAKEREKIDAIEKLAEEARVELERLKIERAEENNSLIRGRAAVESEMEVLSKLRQEVEEQLQDIISNKMEISFERDRINKLRSEAESDNKVIAQLQYELEVERKALSLARTWAEEEAKRAREQARALEEARDRWEKHGIKVVVDDELLEDASTGITWLTAGKQTPVDELTINRAESLVEKLKAMACELKVKSSAALERIIQKIVSFISSLKNQASRASQSAIEVKDSILSKASGSIEELKEHASAVSSSVSGRAKQAAEDAKEGVEKFTQRFKT